MTADADRPSAHFSAGFQAERVEPADLDAPIDYRVVRYRCLDAAGGQVSGATLQSPAEVVEECRQAGYQRLSVYYADDPEMTELA